jgi:hypothetical protein
MSMFETKARQCAKIREIRATLVAEGLFSLDEQAAALGLSRSTAWVLAKGHHKASGLTAALIKKMLASPRLPGTVRGQILEYVQEKAAGLYGHHLQLRRRFVAQLNLSLENLDKTSLVDRLVLEPGNSRSVHPDPIDHHARPRTAGMTRRSDR